MNYEARPGSTIDEAASAMVCLLADNPDAGYIECDFNGTTAYAFPGDPRTSVVDRWIRAYRRAHEARQPAEPCHLTKREHFAAMAMQATLAWALGHYEGQDLENRDAIACHAAASLAARAADALIAELNKAVPRA